MTGMCCILGAFESAVRIGLGSGGRVDAAVEDQSLREEVAPDGERGVVRVEQGVRNDPVEGIISSRVRVGVADLVGGDVSIDGEEGPKGVDCCLGSTQDVHVAAHDNEMAGVEVA